MPGKVSIGLKFFWKFVFWSKFRKIWKYWKNANFRRCDPAARVIPAETRLTVHLFLPLLLALPGWILVLEKNESRFHSSVSSGRFPVMKSIIILKCAWKMFFMCWSFDFWTFNYRMIWQFRFLSGTIILVGPFLRLCLKFLKKMEFPRGIGQKIKFSKFEFL